MGYRKRDRHPEAEASDAIVLKGVALSAEAKPMRWMKLDAQVYYGQERYDSAKGRMLSSKRDTTRPVFHKPLHETIPSRLAYC